VRGDEIRFRQVLLNLLFNAVKFTPSGGVTIRASADHAQGFLRIEIEDTGIGVPMERRGSIFENSCAKIPRRARNSRVRLGLAIAKRLVEMMHGKIGLEAAPRPWLHRLVHASAGLAWATVGGPARMIQPAPQRGKQRIIIIEDNAWSPSFSRWRWNVPAVFPVSLPKMCPASLAKVAAGGVDLVLLDVSLTNAEWDGRNVNGVELCRILKEKSPADSPSFSPPLMR